MRHLQEVKRTTSIAHWRIGSQQFMTSLTAFGLHLPNPFIAHLCQ